MLIGSAPRIVEAPTRPPSPLTRRRPVLRQSAPTQSRGVAGVASGVIFVGSQARAVFEWLRSLIGNAAPRQYEKHVRVQLRRFGTERV